MSVSRTPLRLAGVCAAGLLVASAIPSASAVTPAPIGPATINFSQAISSTQTPNSSASCSQSKSSTAPNTVTVNPNTAAMTVTNALVGTATDGTTTSNVDISATSTFRTTQTASGPTSISVSYTGTARTGAPLNGCQVSGAAIFNDGYGDGLTVTLTRPMLVTANIKTSSAGLALIALVDQNSVTAVGALAGASGGSGTGQGFVPAGTYGVQFQGGMYLSPTSAAVSRAISGSMSLSFKPAGSRLSGPSGNAGAYVVMGAARTCSTHTLAAHVTGPRYASQIAKVVVLGNGRVLKTVYRPAAGRSLTVKLPDTVTEVVRINVVLRNGKHLYRTASYLRCS